ncbi:MAG: RluA family pseudouridine synthase [Clostridiales bacterium]|nr:RluA family pseudouridine synthase [Clostridiales bacterium]
MKSKFICNEEIRLDVFLASNTSFSRSFIKTMNDEGRILVNGKKEKAGFKLKAGDEIVVDEKEKEQIDVTAEDIPLDIVYEDDDLVVINKQVGLVVHPCSTTKSHTLVNALMHHIKNLSTINGVERPGIVHRLDKDTAGLMIVAKNDYSHKYLSEQLKDKTLNREYKALIRGRIKDDFIVEGYLGRNPKNREQMALVNEKNGKYSKTIFTIDKVYDHFTLLNCKLTTGRTHQIRAHLKSINHPILGDKLYGGLEKTIKTNGQLLFAYKITFVHPSTKEKMTFEADLPDFFKNILKNL